MSEKRITWTAKTRRGMKRIVEEGVVALSLKLENPADYSDSKITKAQNDEIMAARQWLAQELEGDAA